MDVTGEKLYEEYVEERINGNTSLWAPVKRENNKMYTSGNKKQTVKIRDNYMDLRETKDLFGRLIIIAKSNRDVDLKHAIGHHEFTVTPRAFFAASGSVLPCQDKAKLIHFLEKLPTDKENATSGDTVVPSVDESTREGKLL